MVCIWAVTSPLLKILGTSLSGEVAHARSDQVILGGRWKELVRHRGHVGVKGGRHVGLRWLWSQLHRVW